MRDVSSAFWQALQEDNIQICELVTLSHYTGTFRWTTANQDIVNSGDNYTPFMGTTDRGIEESVDLGIGVIDFTMINSGDTFRAIIEANDLDMAGLLIRRVLVNSPNLGSVEIYRGKIGDYSHNRSQITGQARNLFGSINIQWPYYTYMDQCAWRFGSTPCGFNTASITVTGSSTPVSSGYRLGALCSVGSFAPGYYDRGRFTFTSGANSGYARTVRTSSGSRVEFSHAFPYNISSGDRFSLYRGCRKRLVDDCHSTYNNARNALAFPWIPQQEKAF